MTVYHGLELTERELKIMGYSQKTIKSYVYGLGKYFAFKGSELEILDQENIKDFLLDCQQKQISPQTRNLFLNAIKFYYDRVVKTNKKIEIRTAKKESRLPVVLTKEEVEQIIGTVINLKHRLLLALSYSAGLRVSETVALKVADINLEELTINIRQGKGRRDRISVISEIRTTQIYTHVTNPRLKNIKSPW